jgi:hypothetical protein
MPFWILTLAFAYYILKIKISPNIVFMCCILMLAIVLAPLIHKPLQKEFDYLFIPFGVADFSTSLYVFSYWNKKILKTL